MGANDVDRSATRVARLLRLFRRASRSPQGAIALKADDCRSCGSQLAAEELKCTLCGSVRDRPSGTAPVGLMAR